MNNKKVIYTKRFPKISIEELGDALQSNKDFVSLTAEQESGYDFINHLLNESNYLPVSARIEQKEVFTNKIITFSTEYELDADVTEYFGYILANIYIEPGVFSGRIKELFTNILCMADTFSFAASRENAAVWLVSLLYYTHKHYLSGREITYLDECPK